MLRNTYEYEKAVLLTRCM